jgi:hypothetical protein
VTSKAEGDRIARMVLELVTAIAKSDARAKHPTARPYEPTGTGYLEPDVAVHVHKRSDRKVG